MAEKDIALMAHLMRRAGFGATREELEVRAAKGYEATVEELLNPESQNPWMHMISSATTRGHGNQLRLMGWALPSGCTT